MSNSSSSTTIRLPHDLHDESNRLFNGMNYVFTRNNPSQGQLDNIENFGRVLQGVLPRIEHVYWSLEEGESGTVHIQGYIQVRPKIKFQALRNKFTPSGLWVAPAKGSAEQNHAYIGHTGKHAGKPGLLQGPWSYGDFTSAKGPGSRSDIDGLITAIKGGAKLKTLAKEHTNSMLKYFGNAAKLVDLLGNERRNKMTELYIFTGVAGSGKSHTAREEAIDYLEHNNIDEEPYYLPVPAKASDKLWWDGYEGQAVIIIEDFYGEIGLDYFKRLIDKYPMRVDKKNGSAEFLGARVYITSNQGWKSWWGPSLLSNRENQAAIERRITDDRPFLAPYNNNNNNLSAAPTVILTDEELDLVSVVPDNPVLTRSNAMLRPSIFDDPRSPLGQLYNEQLPLDIIDDTVDDGVRSFHDNEDFSWGYGR